MPVMVNAAKTIPPTDWKSMEAFRVHVALLKEDQDYSAIVLNLPGVTSIGDTEEEALKNIQEAVKLTIDSYRDAGKDIPWKDSGNIPAGAKQTWILVDA